MNAQEQLLKMMNPQQAQLMDQQLRERQNIASSQGAGMLSGLVQGTRGAMDAISGVAGTMPMGINQRQAIETQKQQKTMIDAIQNPQGTDRIAQLRDTAKKLRATGNFNALMKAEEYEMMADDLQYKKDDMALKGAVALAKANKPTAAGFTSTEGEHFRDDSGNLYATVLTTNKDSGISDVNYIPIGDAPKFSGQKLQAVVKSGAFSGLTPEEATDMEALKAGNVELAKDFNQLKVSAAQDYGTAKSTHKQLTRALELTLEMAKAGNLEGGIQASLQEAYYNLFGKRPKSMGELNLIFNEAAYSQLKPLFGGNISNGERESVKDTYMDVYKNGQVNVATIENLIKKANGAMFNYNVLMTSDSYEDWTSKLTQESTPASTSTPRKRRRYNPETGQFEEVGA